MCTLYVVTLLTMMMLTVVTDQASSTASDTDAEYVRSGSQVQQ